MRMQQQEDMVAAAKLGHSLDCDLDLVVVTLVCGLDEVYSTHWLLISTWGTERGSIDS